MTDLFLDTHSLLWHLADDPHLSPSARSAIDSAIAHRGVLFFSSVTLVEVIYLQEKRRLAPGSFVAMQVALDRTLPEMNEVPLNIGVVIAMQRIPRSVVPDMPDRIIAATALLLELPLVTADGRIRKLTNLKTVW